MSDNKNKALILDERRIIETGIRNGSTKTAIATTIGKDKSTIGKEIKLHRYLAHKCSLPLECAAYKKCKLGRNCTTTCPGYVPFRCARRDRSPGACNGCPHNSSCRFDKYIYDAARADREYRALLVDARSGVDLTTAEAARMAAVIKPLLDQGISPYQIVTIHPELDICEKTLYNYIEGQVFSIAGIHNIDLRRKVSRKMPKKVATSYKKRQDRSFLKGRTYEDFRRYMQDHPNAHVLEMDTVYNDGSNGPFLQTFKFIGLGLLFALFHDTKTAQDMADGIELLDSILGPALFNTFAEVILTDRGSEFTCADRFESRKDGTCRSRVFYCDPMQGGQKGSLEVNHELLRYILPKGTDLRGLGLTGQVPLLLALSHVNSGPVESLLGKSPIAYTRFLCPELWGKLEAFGLQEIPGDEIILKPYLLKRFTDKAGK